MQKIIAILAALLAVLATLTPLTIASAGKGGCPNANSENGAVHANRNSAHFKHADGSCSPPEAASDFIGVSTTTTITLTWTDNATNEHGFRLERGLGVDGALTQIALLPANTTTFTDVGLQPNTQYCYRLIAFNAAGDSAPASVPNSSLDRTCPTTEP